MYIIYYYTVEHCFNSFLGDDSMSDSDSDGNMDASTVHAESLRRSPRIRKSTERSESFNSQTSIEKKVKDKKTVKHPSPKAAVTSKGNVKSTHSKVAFADENSKTFKVDINQETRSEPTMTTRRSKCISVGNGNMTVPEDKVDTLMSLHKSGSEGFIIVDSAAKKKLQKAYKSKPLISDSDSDADNSPVMGVKCHTKWTNPKATIQDKRMCLKKEESFEEENNVNKENVKSMQIRTRSSSIVKTTRDSVMKVGKSAVGRPTHLLTNEKSDVKSGKVDASVADQVADREEADVSCTVAPPRISRQATRQSTAQLNQDQSNNNDLLAKKASVMKKCSLTMPSGPPVKATKGSTTTRQKLLKRISTNWKKPTTVGDCKKGVGKKAVMLTEAITPPSLLKRSSSKLTPPVTEEVDNCEEQSNDLPQEDVPKKKQKLQVQALTNVHSLRAIILCYLYSDY